MKIRVTTEGKSVVIDMDQALAEKVFKAIVLQLLQASGLFLPQGHCPRLKYSRNPVLYRRTMTLRTSHIKSWMGCISIKDSCM